MKNFKFQKTWSLILFLGAFWVKAQTLNATFVANGVKYQVTSATAPLTVSVIANSPVYSGSVTVPSTVSDGTYTYGVTSIGAQAFYGCTALTSVTIPSSITSIQNYAFQASNLSTSFIIQSPSSLTSIGVSAFQSSNINAITIPSSVTSIGASAFYGCGNLTSITIPSSVTSIGGSAFYACSGLTSFTFQSPVSVTSIANYTFYGCTGLTSFTIPNTVTSIGTQALYHCIGLTSLAIPSSVTTIGQQAFQSCTGLTSLAIPSSVTSIVAGAFYGCTGLTSFTFQSPVSVTSLGNVTFNGCSALTSIIIPSSITSIGTNCFNACSALSSVTSLNTTPPTLLATVFSGIASNACLHVPSGYTSTYTSANSQWNFSCIDNNTLSTTDVTQNTTVLYPNPAKDFVTLNNLAHGVDVSVLDMSGKVLYHTKATNTTLTINTSSFAKGVYLVNVNGKVSKLVVAK